jgi:hypothetical protein
VFFASRSDLSTSAGEVVSLRGLTSLASVSEVGMSEQGWRDFLAAESVGD